MNPGESGFLFLEDCEVSMRGSRSTANEKDSSSDAPTTSSNDQWLPLHTANKAGHDETLVQDKDAEGYCPHCWLTFQWQAGSSSSIEASNSVVAVEPTPRFDGTTLDLKPRDNLCSCVEKLRQRSDGALLLGLALTCQDMGHVVIRSVEVFLRSDRRQNDPLLAVEESSGYRRAAMLITVSVPEINDRPHHQGSPSGQSRRRKSQPGLPRRRFISNSSKPLPAATQLLLSILRSDWNFFDQVRKRPDVLSRARIDESSFSLSRSLSFFPSKLSLDEVYQRIGGAAASFLDREESVRPFDCARSKLTSTCVDLPNDVWQYHVGAFLKAKSLDALRCTSKYFHRILQEVVPGLRLRLYAHQVKSLSWMRLRETRPVTENELSLSENQETTVHMDDLHNAAAGGATVLLRSRSSSSTYHQQQRPSVHRISQYNGDEVILRSDDPLSRSVARGGLLCDDPGLGKTITVLSLILQTLGLSTEPKIQPSDHKGEGKGSETYEERIFSEYWREQSIPQFRAQALNKLLSTFIRSNPATNIFMFPVDPEGDGVLDYFDVISNPICLQDVRKRINKFQYDDSFSSFESDVIQCFR